jgi:hypothetical protein
MMPVTVFAQTLGERTICARTSLEQKLSLTEADAEELRLLGADAIAKFLVDGGTLCLRPGCVLVDVRHECASKTQDMADSLLEDKLLIEVLMVLEERRAGVKPFGVVCLTHNASLGRDAQLQKLRMDTFDVHSKRWFGFSINMKSVFGKKTPTSAAGKAMAVGIAHALRQIVSPTGLFVHFTSDKLCFVEQCVRPQFRAAHRHYLDLAGWKRFKEPSVEHERLLSAHNRFEEVGEHVDVLRAEPGHAMLFLLARTEDLLLRAIVIAERFVKHVPRDEFRPCYERSHIAAFGVGDISDIRRLRRIDLFTARLSQSDMDTMIAATKHAPQLETIDLRLVRTGLTSIFIAQLLQSESIRAVAIPQELTASVRASVGDVLFNKKCVWAKTYVECGNYATRALWAKYDAFYRLTRFMMQREVFMSAVLVQWRPPLAQASDDDGVVVDDDIVDDDSVDGLVDDGFDIDEEGN